MSILSILPVLLTVFVIALVSVALFLLWRLTALRQYSEALEQELERFKVARASDAREITRLKSQVGALQSELHTLRKGRPTR